jgi:hypothetical protein
VKQLRQREYDLRSAQMLDEMADAIIRYFVP